MELLVLGPVTLVSYYFCPRPGIVGSTYYRFPTGIAAGERIQSALLSHKGVRTTKRYRQRKKDLYSAYFPTKPLRGTG